MIAVAVPISSCRQTQGPALASLPDSIEVETVCALPTEFGDRYITGIAFDRMLTDKGPDVFAFVSSDGLHLAFEQHGASGSVVTVDGVRGKTYDIAAGGKGTFSLEGGHFAYFARSSARGDLALVVDGREIDIDRDHDHEVVSPLILSADGSRWSYVGRSLRDGRSFVVTDAGRDRPYDGIGGPVLSWDGRQIVYVADKVGRSIFVQNGRETAAFDVASLPVFDLSGQHCDYVEGRVGQRVVLDGEAVDTYESRDKKNLSL